MPQYNQDTAQVSAGGGSTPGLAEATARVMRSAKMIRSSFIFVGSAVGNLL